MIHINEMLHETVRIAKTPPRYAAHPNKARKHRYERRKVRSVIRLGEWNEEDLF